MKKGWCTQKFLRNEVYDRQSRPVLGKKWVKVMYRRKKWPAAGENFLEISHLNVPEEQILGINIKDVVSPP